MTKIMFISDKENIITLILSKNVDLNKTYGNGNTPFLYAVRCLRENTARLMIQKGGIEEIHKKKALLILIGNASSVVKDIIKIPLNKEVQLSAVKATKPHVSLFKFLLDHMTPGPWDLPEDPPTFVAARDESGYPDMLKILIERNFYLNYQNKEGKELIHILCENKNHSISENIELFQSCINLLISKGVDINARDALGRNCLYYSLEYIFKLSREEVGDDNVDPHKISNRIKFLLAKGAKTDIIDENDLVNENKASILLYLMDFLKIACERHFFSGVEDENHDAYTVPYFITIFNIAECLFDLFLWNSPDTFIDVMSVEGETFIQQWEELYGKIVTCVTEGIETHDDSRGALDYELWVCNYRTWEEAEAYVKKVMFSLNEKISSLKAAFNFFTADALSKGLVEEATISAETPKTIIPKIKNLLHGRRHKDGKTLLHLASEHRHPQLFVELLRHKADDTLPDKQKIKPIDIMSDIEKTINALIRIKIPKIQLIHTELQTLYSAEQKNRTDSDKKLTKDKEEKGSKELSAIQGAIQEKSKAMIELGKDCLKDILAIKKDSHFGKYMKEYCEDYCAILYRLFYQKDVLRPWFDVALAREFIDNISSSSRYFVDACHVKFFLNLTIGPASKHSLSLEDEETEDPSSEHLLTLLHSYPSLADTKGSAHSSSAPTDSASIDNASLADVTTDLEKKSDHEEKNRLFQALVNQFIFNQDSVTPPIPDFTGMNATSIHKLLSKIKEKVHHFKDQVHALKEEKLAAEKKVTLLQSKIAQLEKDKDKSPHAASTITSALEPIPSPAPAPASAIPAASIPASGSSIATSAIPCSTDPATVALTSSSTSSASSSSALSSSAFEKKTLKDLPAPPLSASQNPVLPFISASSASSSSSSSDLPSEAPSIASSAAPIILTKILTKKRKTPEENSDLLSEERSSNKPRKERGSKTS